MVIVPVNDETINENTEMGRSDATWIVRILFGFGVKRDPTRPKPYEYAMIKINLL
jgi:hypothetical protein